VAAVPTPRVMEKWVRHGLMQFAKDRLEKSEGIREARMMRPWKVKVIIREGHILLPAGVMRAAVMARANETAEFVAEYVEEEDEEEWRNLYGTGLARWFEEK